MGNYESKRFIKNPEHSDLEKIIKIDRVNKVVKGGKRLAFRALVVTGDQNGEVGFGLGKSKEVPIAIKKAIDKAKKNRIRFKLFNGTIPHDVLGKFGSSKVILRPAKPGTGVIAGGAVRIFLETLGIKDIVAKSIGSRNPFNAIKATVKGLSSCKNLDIEEKARGKKLPVYFRSINSEKD